MKTTPRHLASSFATSSSGSLNSRSTSSECPSCPMFASFRSLLSRSAIPSLWTSPSSPTVLSPWLNSSRPRLRSSSVDPSCAPVSLRQVLFLLAAILISAPFLIRRILDGDTLIHDQRLWMSLALFVYFGVFGTMHNIIRSMPMVLSDRNNPDRIIFFYQGSGMQLGVSRLASCTWLLDSFWSS